LTKKVKYTITISVENGPSFSIPDEIDTSNGYDVVEEDIDAAGNVTFDTHSGSKDKIDLLCIKSSKYHKDITYTLNGDEAGGNAILRPLNRAQVIIGNNTAQYLPADPTSIQIVNGSAEDITVEILIVRRK